MSNNALRAVLAMQRPVFPDGGQGPYFRSKVNVVTDETLRSVNSCVADEMSGESFADRQAAKDEFSSVASECHSKAD